jgi:hypothetical protein
MAIQPTAHRMIGVFSLAREFEERCADDNQLDCWQCGLAGVDFEHSHIPYIWSQLPLGAPLLGGSMRPAAPARYVRASDGREDLVDAMAIVHGGRWDLPMYLAIHALGGRAAVQVDEARSRWLAEPAGTPPRVLGAHEGHPFPPAWARHHLWADRILGIVRCATEASGSAEWVLTEEWRALARSAACARASSAASEAATATACATASEAASEAATATASEAASAAASAASTWSYDGITLPDYEDLPGGVRPSSPE